MNHSIRIAASVSILIVWLGLSASPATAAPTVVRVFHLQHVSALDASKVIQPLLSDGGSLTIQPHQSRITVQDSPEVVAEIADRLAELDRAPERFKIEVELIEGTDRKVPVKQQAELPARARRMFPFHAYRQIGTAIFEGEIGTPSSAVLGGSYRVSFLATAMAVDDNVPWGIPHRGTRYHLEWLTLERLTAKGTSKDGGDGDDDGKAVNILRTSMYLSSEQEIITGIGRSEDAAAGLVLILRAKPRDAE